MCWEDTGGAGQVSEELRGILFDFEDALSITVSLVELAWHSGGMSPDVHTSIFIRGREWLISLGGAQNMECAQPCAARVMFAVRRFCGAHCVCTSLALNASSGHG